MQLHHVILANLNRCHEEPLKQKIIIIIFSFLLVVSIRKTFCDICTTTRDIITRNAQSFS